MSIRDVLRCPEDAPDLIGPEPQATTLEAHHQSRLRLLEETRDSLPTLRAELEKELNSLVHVAGDTDEWRTIKEKCDRLSNDIKRIEKDEERLNYFLNVGDLLFDYFEAQETVAKGETVRRRRLAGGAPVNSVLSYFSTESPVKSDDVDGPSIKRINVEEGLNRDKMLEKYLAVIDPAAIKSGILPGSGIEQGWGTCRTCGIEMTFYQNEAILGCPRCGVEEYLLIDSEKPSYKDPPREITYFAYKKINHFNEWLAQFQAKENTDIPQEIVESVMRELRKERISDPKKIKKEKILEILRKLKLSKMYEHVQQIKNRIQHQMTNLTLSKEMEEKLQHMFREIQPAFIKYCPASRSNFLSYPYVLYKLCQLLEMDEYLPFFQLLKSREKLYQQDQVWRLICAEMRWQFIKSI